MSSLLQDSNHTITWPWPLTVTMFAHPSAHHLPTILPLTYLIPLGHLLVSGCFYFYFYLHFFCRFIAWVAGAHGHHPWFTNIQTECFDLIPHHSLTVSLPFPFPHCFLHHSFHLHSITFLSPLERKTVGKLYMTGVLTITPWLTWDMWWYWVTATGNEQVSEAFFFSSYKTHYSWSYSFVNISCILTHLGNAASK